ncbi:type III-B CRISPR module-associated Cmr3 family protein [Chloracidobacterium thermophilum]|jgi:CRISPR-associated protein Cmr3|uniref:CRISPR-associated protein (Cas_Cmr3) n=1 Tax=Chloracidobacterium thermophilum (strain B) TaxID=981222 RepID=G2LGI7_CHLTF|nr:type III-B CRISPR module-associated Cmr3 family protein [Chloracidobacterium thermophilum]AEP10947.1 CRISPR-associated protein (Cas_Cmr3) [Chloracidobacterium thermophilum B]QUV78873.1 CRISPR-associated protein Crm3 [Chloracidobacterium thermophilum]
MTTYTYLALLPRDGLFCKDGRGWYTSASGRGHGLDWPWPSTILGALRTAWGRTAEAVSGKLFDHRTWLEETAAVQLGRMLTLRRPPDTDWNTTHLVWPVPLDALWLAGRPEVCRLQPLPSHVPTLGRDDDAARETLWRPALEEAGKPLPSPRWWRQDDFVAWLTGQPVSAQKPFPATARRVQTRVGIRPETLTTDDGLLFSHDVLETLELHAEWAIGVEVTLPGGAVDAVATLGSDSRLVRIETLPETLFAPPARLLETFQAGSRGLRIIAVTPLAFARGWLPDGFEQHDGQYVGRLPGLPHDLVLRAAFVPRPLHVSGWNRAAHSGKGAPKPTARMVAPGAVYFFERVDEQPFDAAHARSLWLAALGARTEEGFGRVVPGIWHPTPKTPNTTQPTP